MKQNQFVKFAVVLIRMLTSGGLCILVFATARRGSRLKEGFVQKADLRTLQLSLSRGVKLPFERDASIAELFAAQVRRTPAAVALQSISSEWTYSRLDEWSDSLASRLAGVGVGRRSRIGLLLDRSPGAVASMLGVARLGAAFVPFDTQYPTHLLADLINDASPDAIISRRDIWGSASLNFDSPVLLLDESSGDASKAGPHPNRQSAHATDPAYVMYTSGSTGRQKGVVVPHRAIARLVRNTDFAELGPDEVFLQLAPISFDASTLEIWGALLNGGRLTFLDAKTPSLSQIADAIRQFRVTTLWLTAGLFHLMVDRHIEAFAPLRQLLAGGDVLSPVHVSRVMAAHPHLRVINGYGPTENTTFTCCYTVPSRFAGGALPIGRPIANTHVVILDDELKPVPVGEIGQLCAGGDGVALGYLN
ncbi:AMP-binding protein, partial [Nostoc sp. NIES-2111]